LPFKISVEEFNQFTNQYSKEISEKDIELIKYNYKMLKLAQEKELKNKSNLYPKNQKQYNKKFDLR